MAYHSTNGEVNGHGSQEDIQNATSADIIIVGAGPVGLLLALKLGLQGISTILIEKQKEILKAPRAVAYMPVVNKQLKSIGLLEPVAQRAFQTFNGPSWRPVQGKAHVLCEPTEIVAQLLQEGADLPPPPPQDENCVYMIGQDELSTVIFEQIQLRCPKYISVRFQRPCVGVNNVPGGVEVMTTDKSPENKQYQDIVLAAKYVIGADGAQSAVRQYACIPFEGFTWTNFRFTAADVEYDFQKESGYSPANFIVDPYDWAVIVRTGPNNVFRIAYGELPDTPDDEASLLERSKERIPRFLSPNNKNYKLRRLKPYWAQQRCAQTFQKGRILLVGDAAHVSPLAHLLRLHSASSRPHGALTSELVKQSCRRSWFDLRHSRCRRGW
jgi:2-polyprenyl-6-methoxyphenol hydroxylase-like FAD-dependent oxidoreductase